MAKAGGDGNSGQKTVPADCVSVLLMALDRTTITKAQYEMMSALDGTRTASSFEHQFRSITAKAKELKSRVENGDRFEPVRPTTKRGAGSSAASPATPRKRKSVSEDCNDTPSKKKATPLKQAEMSYGDFSGMQNTLPDDMNDFIKSEAGFEI